MLQATDYVYMARAIKLARRGLYTTHPNPRVGCVLVKNGDIVGEGFHVSAGLAHAEINALQVAGHRAAGASAYVTLEPCCHHGRTSPCTDALVAAGISRVVIAMQDPNPLVSGKGIKILQEAGIEVECGILKHEAEALNRGFVSRMHRNRPWIRLKSAISMDGKTAMASGESKWITGPPARHEVQLLRAQSAAIMTSSSTIMMDNPSLNLRLSSADLQIEGEPRQPLRVILDTHLKCSAKARVFNLPGPSLVVTASGDPTKMKQLRLLGVELERVSREGLGVNLGQAMSLLAAREINELQVEAGPILSGALIERGLVDEMVIYMAPHLMGDKARGLAQLSDVERMAERVKLKLQDVRMIGEDLRITAARAN